MSLPASILAFVLALTCCSTSQAGERDKNKPVPPPVDPVERMEKLLETLKSDRKEDQRVKAIEELGKLASAEFPEVVPALIDALIRDASTAVRKSAIRTLAGIEPETYEIKDALEQAVKQDKAWTVRQTARFALFRYKPKDEPPTTSGPKQRNTSKPTSTGKVPATKTPPRATPPDPFKSMPIPMPTVPVIPAEGASLPPALAAPPGLFHNTDPVPRNAQGEPARLTAPKPSGK